MQEHKKLEEGIKAFIKDAEKAGTAEGDGLRAMMDKLHSEIFISLHRYLGEERAIDALGILAEIIAEEVG